MTHEQIADIENSLKGCPDDAPASPRGGGYYTAKAIRELLDEIKRLAGASANWESQCHARTQELYAESTKVVDLRAENERLKRDWHDFQAGLAIYRVENERLRDSLMRIDGVAGSCCTVQHALDGLVAVAQIVRTSLADSHAKGASHAS